MKLVRQAKLFFREGNSDKVYEVDLCESGAGEYIVNFRYGRRGASLKEGTKTIFPVSLAEAEKVFDGLVQEKKRKGYTESWTADTAASSGKKSSKQVENAEQRDAAIMTRLREAAGGKKHEDWKLSRIIWRAGELQLQEAEALILKVADQNDHFNLYAAVWALGRCGSAAAVPFLQQVAGQTTIPAYIPKLARFALSALLEGEARKNFFAAITAELEEPLKSLVALEQTDALEKYLRNLNDFGASGKDVLSTLWLLAQNEEKLRNALLRVFRDLPLRTGVFKYLRSIFKTAEMLDDFNAYGLLARRFEKTPANYNSYTHGTYVDNSYVRISEEKAKPDSKLSFSTTTKRYLVERVIRRLNDFGTSQRADYTKLATALLLQYSDKLDNPKTRKETKYKYHYDRTTRRSWTEEKHTFYDLYSDALLLNTILYSNSPRYFHKFRNKEWICQPSYEPGKPAPDVREEGFPERWNNDHESVFTLLGRSRCLRVHEFAVKVFRANPTFEDTVSEEQLCRFLASGFSITEQLGAEVVQKKFQNKSPGKPLLLALLDCGIAEARQLARQWILRLRTEFLTDAAFVADMICVRNEESRSWLSGILSMDAMPAETAAAVVKRLIDHIVALANTYGQEKEIDILSSFLVQHFDSVVSVMPFENIRALLESPAGALHIFAGKILLRHKAIAENFQEELLLMLLQSSEAAARSAGIGLLGRQTDEQLMARRKMLVSFCISEKPDIRASVQPLITRLAAAYPTFAAEMAALFMPVMQMKETYEGLHNDLLALLLGPLAPHLGGIDQERILKLLHSKFIPAQELGFSLLQKNLNPTELPVPALVKIGSHALIDVRHWTWSVFEKETTYIKSDTTAAIKLVDSIWDDTRAFAFRFFRERLETSDWTPQLFVTLCDSVREDVQAFGREMITRCFEDKDGKEYLAKLSQHPDSRMQLFASSFLEKYAGGNSETINRLEPYFVTLLSQVNKGRAAKERAFAFLEQESMAREETAMLTAQILSRISATMAIHDKAKCIVLLSRLQQKYPGITSPVVIKETRLYNPA